MDILNIPGIGQMANKILDALSKATGVVYKPTAIRKEAKAEGDRIREIARAEMDALTIKTEGKIDLFLRSKERLANQELKRQQNLESIALMALDDVSSEIGSTKEIDEDWMMKFTANAQDICSEQMQKVWAKVLSQEARSPGQFSLRALSTLNTMSKQEALLFQELCKFALPGGNILRPSIGTGYLTKYGLKYSDLLLLRHAGLLHDSNTLSTSFPVSDDVLSLKMPSQFGNLFINRQDANKPFKFDVFVLTPVGIELMALLEREELSGNQRLYLNDLVIFLATKGLILQIEHA